MASYSDSTNLNMKCVAYLMDTNLWSDYANENYATYAIGGTTLEMWVASWNEKGYTELYCNNIDSYGYYIGDSNLPTSIKLDVTSQNLENSGYDDELYFPGYNYDIYGAYHSYYLASPAADLAWDESYQGENAGLGLYAVVDNGVVQYIYTDYRNRGFRPLICLASDVKLIENGDSTYSIYQ